MTKATAVLLAAIVLTAPLAGAQSIDRITVDFGAGKGRRLDAAISPVALKGTGGRLALGYERRRDEWSASLRIGAGASVMLPDAVAPGSEETVGAYTARLAVLREVSATAFGGIASLGLAVDGSLTLTSHHDDDAARNSSTFSMGIASVSAAGAWRHVFDGGMLRLGASVPLVSVAQRPWAGQSAQRPAAGPGAIGPTTLRAATFEGDYEREVRPGISMRTGYRAEVFQLDEVQAVRALQHSFSFGLVFAYALRGT